MAAFLRRRGGARAIGGSVVTARLLEALARPGCPLCRVLAATAGLWGVKTSYGTVAAVARGTASHVPLGLALRQL